MTQGAQEQPAIMEEFKRRQAHRRTLALLLILAGILGLQLQPYFMAWIDDHPTRKLLAFACIVGFTLVLVILDRPNSFCPACNKRYGWSMGPLWSRSPLSCRNCGVRLR